MLRKFFTQIVRVKPYFRPHYASLIHSIRLFSSHIHNILEENNVPGVIADPFDSNDNFAKKCKGCGAPLQTIDSDGVGYISQKRLEQYPGGVKRFFTNIRGVPVDVVPHHVSVDRRDSKTNRYKVQLLYCHRCFNLQNFKRMNTRVSSGEDFYKIPAHPTILPVDSDAAVKDLVKTIPNGSLTVMVVDLLDLETSIVPELFTAVRSKQLPVIWAINKVDALPQGTDLAQVKDWVRRMVRQVKNAPVGDVVLLSGAQGYGMAELEKRMQTHIDPAKPSKIFFIGRVNCGKSTLLNRFLGHIGFLHMGSLHLKQGRGGLTASPLPGTTVANVEIALPKGFHFVDTPGIPLKDPLSHLTSRMESIDDLDALVPRRQLKPLSYPLKPGKSLFLGAMARLDNVGTETAIVSILIPDRVSIHIASTHRAADFMRRKATTFLTPPSSKTTFKSLQPFVKHRVDVHGESWRAWDEIAIAGLGWVGVTGWGKREFDVWVPKGIRVFRRPAMLPYEATKPGSIKNWRGKCGRGRSPHQKDRRMRTLRAMNEVETRKQLQSELESNELNWMGSASLSEVEGGRILLIPSREQVLAEEGTQTYSGDDLYLDRSGLLQAEDSSVDKPNDGENSIEAAFLDSLRNPFKDDINIKEKMN